VLHPAGQLRDEDGVDLSRLGERHRLLTLNAVVLGAGRGLLEHGDDVVASAPGERPKIAFLALAGLIVGAHPAVDGNLSQLDPLGNWAAEVPQLLSFCSNVSDVIGGLSAAWKRASLSTGSGRKLACAGWTLVAAQGH